jgi:pimeloyl-ACP methyl ester carboxylesterase
MPTVLMVRTHPSYTITNVDRINLQIAYRRASNRTIRHRRLTNPHASEGIRNGAMTAPCAGKPGTKPEDEYFNRRLERRRIQMVSRTPIRATFFRLNGVPVTYRDLNVEVHGDGDAAPLLLLHGWGSSGQNMRPLAEALSSSYQTHTIDLPGHGASPPPPEPWGVPEHADLLYAYVENEIQGAVAVLGHSNGGRIALYMASTPDMADAIDRLVLISPSGVQPQRSLGYHLRSGIAKTLKAPFQVLPSPLREPAVDWLRHSLVWRLLGSSDYNTLSGTMRETFVKTVNHHLNGALQRIQVPTLLFWGTEDEAVSRRQMTVIENAIDDCGLVELEGAGHYGHLDDFNTVLAATRHFLETG